MSGTTDFVSCPNIQKTMDNEFLTLTNRVNEHSPFLETIVSPLNTRGAIQKLVDSGNGHIKTVEIVYDTREVETAVSDSAVRNCEGGDTDNETSTPYQIDTEVGSSISWTVNIDDLIERCEGDEVYVARQIQKKMNVLIRKMDTDCLTQAALLKGNFATTGLSTAITVATKNADGVDVPDAIERIRYEYLEMEFGGVPIAVGGNQNFFDYFNRMGFRCCNTTVGLDLGELYRNYTILPIYDRKVESAIGAGKVLTFAPGALQLLTYNQFQGPKGVRVVDTEIYKQGILVDPLTGIKFDFFAKLDCGNWVFQLKVAHVLVGMPNDMFKETDRLNGVNWVNQFTITNP